jgi:hypothetical protein
MSCSGAVTWECPANSTLKLCKTGSSHGGGSKDVVESMLFVLNYPRGGLVLVDGQVLELGALFSVKLLHILRNWFSELLFVCRLGFVRSSEGNQPRVLISLTESFCRS